MKVKQVSATEIKNGCYENRHFFSALVFRRFSVPWFGKIKV